MPYEAQPAPEAISTGQYGKNLFTPDTHTHTQPVAFVVEIHLIMCFLPGLPGSSYQSELPGQRGMLPGKYGEFEQT